MQLACKYSRLSAISAPRGVLVEPASQLFRPSGEFERSPPLSYFGPQGRSSGACLSAISAPVGIRAEPASQLFRLPGTFEGGLPLSYFGPQGCSSGAHLSAISAPRGVRAEPLNGDCIRRVRCNCFSVPILLDIL